MPVRELRAKLDQAHELLRRAQGVPEGDRLWLLTLAWAQLHEAAGALETIGATPSRPDHPEAAAMGRRDGHNTPPRTQTGIS